MFVVLSAVPTLILSGARVGGGGLYVVQLLHKQDPPLSLRRLAINCFCPFSRSCAFLSSEAACDCVFPVTRRTGEGENGKRGKQTCGQVLA